MPDYLEDMPALTVSAKAPNINTTKGKLAIKNMADGVLAGTATYADLPRQYHSAVQADIAGRKIAKARDNSRLHKMLLKPIVYASAFGLPAAAAALFGEFSNIGINALTKGKANSWGELFTDNPTWASILDMTNPLYAFGYSSLSKGMNSSTLSAVKDIIGRSKREAIKDIADIISNSPRLFNNGFNSSRSYITDLLTRHNRLSTYYGYLSKGSKLTEKERMGIPKAVRNLIIKNEGYIPKDRFTDYNQLFPIDNSEIIPNDSFIPNSLIRYTNKYRNSTRDGFNFLNVLDKTAFKTPEENSKFADILTKYANSLSDIDDRFLRKDGLPSFYIKQYRDYLSSLGYKSDKISESTLAKIMTQQYKDLSSTATGKLKGRLVFHASNQPISQFDYNFLGSNTGNMGYNGAGNYFSTYPNVYGDKQVQSIFGNEYKIGLTQPYMISDITSVPINYTKTTDKLGLPHYISNQFYTNQPEKYKQILKQVIDIANTGKHKNMAIVDGYSVYPPQFYTEGNKIPVSEFSIARNDKIKSLFPHPDRFVTDKNSNVTLIPTNWNDIRVNYKYGGRTNK